MAFFTHGQLVEANQPEREVEKEGRAQTVGQQWMDDNQPERMIDEDCLEPSGSSPHKGNIWNTT